MRSPLLLLAGLAACDGDRVLLHNSVVPGKADAIALGDETLDLHRQLPNGQLERVATRNGRVLETFDPQPGQVERLLDLDEDAGRARALAASDDALFVWVDGVAQEPLRTEPGGGAGVLYGALTDGGVVIVRPPQEVAEGEDAPACQAEFVLDDTSVLALPATACSASGALVADPLAPVAWLFTVEASWVLTPDGVTEVDTTGDLAAFDPVTGAAVVATRDSSLVDAFDETGAPVWEETVDIVDHRINDLSTLGTAGAIAAVTTRGASGTVSLLDATSGDPIIAAAMPAAARAVSGGGDGKLLAVSVGEEVHTFLVRLRNGR
jgi:hypothetical protein